MLREAVVGNLSGFIMNNLSARHLTAQVYSKTPGDFATRKEVTILNSDGAVVATTYTDFTGRFPMINMHPDENYTFMVKDQSSDIKISVMDDAGDVLTTVEKNRKGKYLFDKITYDTVHTKLNLAHNIVNPQQRAFREAAIASVNRELHKADSNKVAAISPAPQVVQNTVPVATPVKDAAKEEAIKPLEEIVTRKENEKVSGRDDVQPVAGETGNEKIVPVAAPEKESQKDQVPQQTARTDRRRESIAAIKAKQAAEIAFRSKDNAALIAAVKAYETDGLTLDKLGETVTEFYNGVVVCVLDQKGNLLGIGEVNADNNFMLNGYLPFYHINLPEANKNTASEIIFLNDRLEVIKTVRKGMKNGESVTRSTFALNFLTASEVKSDEAARPFSSIYFDDDNAELSVVAKSKLNKIIGYLNNDPQSAVDLVAYTDPGSVGGNFSLAQKRINAITKYLQSREIFGSRINSRAYSKDEQAIGDNNKTAEDADEVKKKYNRLDIYIK
jgi:outer membrane protein OmpA-like peptidoglycan-associated protein